MFIKNGIDGSSLVVQWLGLSAFTAGAQVQSLVREMRSHKPRRTATRMKWINKLCHYTNEYHLVVLKQ